MATKSDWRRGYAIQARAALLTREVLSRQPVASLVPECHRLLFLQMACEKLVKAHLQQFNPVPRDTRSSHAVIAKHLPTIINEHYRRSTGKSMPRHLMLAIRGIAREIELLAPAVDDGGRRPENCEYPWLDHAKGCVIAPVDHPFSRLNLGGNPAARLVLKLLPRAIDELASDRTPS